MIFAITFTPLTIKSKILLIIHFSFSLSSCLVFSNFSRFQQCSFSCSPSGFLFPPSLQFFLRIPADDRFFQKDELHGSFLLQSTGISPFFILFSCSFVTITLLLLPKRKHDKDCEIMGCFSTISAKKHCDTNDHSAFMSEMFSCS